MQQTTRVIIGTYAFDENYCVNDLKRSNYRGFRASSIMHYYALRVNMVYVTLHTAGVLKALQIHCFKFYFDKQEK